MTISAFLFQNAKNDVIYLKTIKNIIFSVLLTVNIIFFSYFTKKLIYRSLIKKIRAPPVDKYLKFYKRGDNFYENKKICKNFQKSGQI